ncbi:MAG: hypothetical protein ACRC0L_00325, partial [Angustibacter sp.]
EFGAELKRLTGLAPELTPGDPITAESAVVLGAGRNQYRALSERVGQLAVPLRTTTLGSRGTTAVAAGWLVLYWVTASGITLLAMLREVGDRGMLALSGANLLRRLTLTEREVGQVNRWLWFFPISLAALIGYGTAVLFALAEQGGRLTGSQLARISGSALLALVASSLLLALVYTLSRRVEQLAARRGLVGGFEHANVPQ